MKLINNPGQPRVVFNLKRPVHVGDVPVHIEALPIGYTAMVKASFRPNLDGVRKVVKANAAGQTTTQDDLEDPEYLRREAQRDNRIKIVLINRAISFHPQQGFSVTAKQIMDSNSQAERESMADRCVDEATANHISQGDIDDLFLAIMTLSNEMDLWPQIGGSFLPVREPATDAGSQSDMPTNS